MMQFSLEAIAKIKLLFTFQQKQQKGDSDDDSIYWLANGLNEGVSGDGNELIEHVWS